MSAAGVDQQAQRESASEGRGGAPSAAIEPPEGGLLLAATIAGGLSAVGTVAWPRCLGGVSHPVREGHAVGACGKPGSVGGEHAFAEFGEGAVEQAGDVHLGDTEVFADLGLGAFVDEAHGDDAPFAVVEFGDEGGARALKSSTSSRALSSVPMKSASAASPSSLEPMVASREAEP
jgi:hypothetical protein